MIIDSHLHIGLNGWTEDSLIKYLDDNDIDKAWILTWDEKEPVAPIYYFPLDIKLVHSAFKKYPDRIIPFYAPDPGRPDWKAQLNYYLDEGFAGCGELKVPYRWNDPLMQPLLELLNHRKIPLVFHMERARRIFIPKRDRGPDWLFKRLINERFNGRVAHRINIINQQTGFLNGYLKSRMVDFPGYLLDFTELENAAIQYSNIKFIAHGPHVWNNFSIPLKDYLFHQEGKIRGKGKLWDLLQEHENIFCDLSGFSAYNALSRDPIHSKEFLENNYKKLLFGTDNMDLGLLELLKDLSLRPEHLDSILSINAKTIIES